MQPLQDIKEQCIEEYSLRWEPHRSKFIALTEKSIKELTQHRKNANIASITGSSASVAAGVTALTCLSLAPVTGGLSLIVGGSMALFGLGTATVIGTNVVESMLNKFSWKKINKAFEEDRNNTERLIGLFRQCIGMIDIHLRLVENVERPPGPDFTEVVGGAATSAFTVKQFSNLSKVQDGLKTFSAVSGKLFLYFNVLQNIHNDTHNIGKRVVELTIKEVTEYVHHLKEMHRQLERQEKLFKHLIERIQFY